MTTAACPDPAFPPYFEIETIRSCNARCVFCPYGTGQIKNEGLMDRRLYEKIENEIIEHRQDVIRATLAVYCEPLLDPDLENKIARLKTGGIGEVAVTTNASLLDERRGARLLEAGVDIVRMSISTINADKYKELRVGLDFDAVLANARSYFRLRDRINPKSRIYVSMEKHDVLTPEDIDLWKREWRDLAGPGDMLKVTIYYDRIVEDRSHLGEEKQRGPCPAIFQTLDIAYDGTALFCSADFKAGRSEYSLGNLTEKSIEEIWNGKAAKHYRELHRAGRRNDIHICRGCDIWDVSIKENITFS